MKLHLMNAPENYFQLLENDISTQLVSGKQIPDLIHFFAKNKSGFEKGMNTILSFVKKNSAITIWVSWYKKSSGMATDLTEDVIRNFALQHDLVDVKVCAVSDVWSGLKLVVPVLKRK
jgi:hypothetical protein